MAESFFGKIAVEPKLEAEAIEPEDATAALLLFAFGVEPADGAASTKGAAVLGNGVLGFWVGTGATKEALSVVSAKTENIGVVKNTRTKKLATNFVSS